MTIKNQYEKITIEKVNEIALSLQLEVITKHYTNAKAYLQIKCIRCNRISNTISWETLKKAKYGCKYCSKTLGIKKGGKVRKKKIPSTENDWHIFFKQYNLIFHNILNSSEKTGGRVYKCVEYSCGNLFDESNEIHPPNIKRITNIERDIKSYGKINCKYCERKNHMSSQLDNNYKKESERLKNKFIKFAKSIDAKFVDGQKINGVTKKYKFIKNGITKSILGTNALRLGVDPWTRYLKVSKKLVTKYHNLAETCKMKGFELITTEIEYDQIIEYDKEEYSPSTRRVTFKYQGTIYSYPIGNIMRKMWFPKDNTVLEEIVRYVFESLFDFKYNFITSYPKDLKSQNGRPLELDGYCENINGYKIAFEHQGKQHETFKYNNRDLPNQEENDKIKKSWCIKENITLIEIFSLGKDLKFDSLLEFIKNELKKYCPELLIENKSEKINLPCLYEYIGKKKERKIDAVIEHCRKFGFNASFDRVTDKGELLFILHSKSSDKSLKESSSVLFKYNKSDFAKLFMTHKKSIT